MQLETFLFQEKTILPAEVVYANVSKEFPNISLGTVYRNLSFLVDNGQAVKVPCDDGSVILMEMLCLITIFNAQNVELLLI